jgi:CRP-like cAMP-binding protein
MLTSALTLSRCGTLARGSRFDGCSLDRGSPTVRRASFCVLDKDTRSAYPEHATVALVGANGRESAMQAIKISHQLLVSAGSPAISYAPGEVIFKEGDKADKMYVVLSGELEVHLQDMVIDTIGAGSTFGEMALIDGSPRSATVIAKTRSEVAAIDEKTFIFLVDEMPYFALSTMRNLVDRLRRMNEQWLALRPRALGGA